MSCWVSCFSCRIGFFKGLVFERCLYFCRLGFGFNTIFQGCHFCTICFDFQNVFGDDNTCCTGRCFKILERRQNFITCHFLMNFCFVAFSSFIASLLLTAAMYDYVGKFWLGCSVRMLTFVWGFSILQGFVKHSAGFVFFKVSIFEEFCSGCWSSLT